MRTLRTLVPLRALRALRALLHVMHAVHVMHAMRALCVLHVLRGLRGIRVRHSAVCTLHTVLRTFCIHAYFLQSNTFLRGEIIGWDFFDTLATEDERGRNKIVESNSSLKTGNKNTTSITSVEIDGYEED